MKKHASQNLNVFADAFSDEIMSKLAGRGLDVLKGGAIGGGMGALLSAIISQYGDHAFEDVAPAIMAKGLLKGSLLGGAYGFGHGSRNK